VQTSPFPVALDEELIGIWYAGKEQLLTKIKPQYIILKPSFVGGFRGTRMDFISRKAPNRVVDNLSFGE
jgi:hypothetical protein